MYIKNTVNYWEIMKEVEVTTGLMMLTFKCVPSRGRYTVGWGKLLREPNHESAHPGAAVYLTRVAWTERNQKIHLSQGVQGHLEKQGHPSHQGTETEREREREKMKVVQLIAAAELWQQKQIIQNEAGKLKIKEKLTKAKNSSIQQHRARTTSCTWIRDWHFWR